jgi:serine/threonine protein kinase
MLGFLKIMNVCEEWRKNPNVNPVTKRKIKPTGAVYKKLEKTCSEDEARRPSARRPSARRPQTNNEKVGESGESADVNYSWVADRMERSRRVTTDLFDIRVQTCVSGPDSKQFISNFLNFKYVGMGCFGRVVRGVTKSGDAVAMKEAYLKKSSFASKEEDIAILLNKLISTNKCPNFIYTFFIGKCQSCDIKTMFSRKKVVSSYPCYVMFMESADSDLRNVSNEINTYEIQSSLLYQIMFALYAIHHYYGILHGDIKTENVLIKKVVPGGYFKYKIGNKSYYVKNVGIVAYLADFGVAEILSRPYAPARFYGARLAYANTDTMKWEPIRIPGNTPLLWNTDDSPEAFVSGTVNDIVSEKGYRKLENAVSEMFRGSSNPPPRINEDAFPPFEFFYDMQDVMRMFVGGKRMLQSGNHNSVPLNAEMKFLLDKIGAIINYEMVFTRLDTLKYVLVQFMIESLYREDPESPKIVATFEM